MVSQDALLVTLVQLVESLPMPTLATKRGRGHPNVYSDRLFFKALVIMIVRHLHTVHELLSVLAQPTAEMTTLRQLLTEQESFPSRRTWERRLKAIPDTLPAQIGCLGRHLIDLIEPWASCGRAVAIESTVLQSRGGVWHHKHREKGEIPHTSIDTEARLPQIGLAWLGLWLETARRLGGGRRLVSHRGRADPRECSQTVSLLLLCCAKCPPKCALSWEIAMTTRPTCMRFASAMTGCWSPPSMDATLILMMAWKSAASFTNCVPWPSKILMSISKAFLMGMDTFPPKACWLPNASP